MKKIQISLIAAISKSNRVIGTEDGNIPWHITEDFKYFKKKTSGHPIVMGRKTFESLSGRILPNRPHIIVTNQKKFLEKVYIEKESEDRKLDLHIVSDFQKALILSKKIADEMSVKEVFVIGGGTTYQETIGIADKLYLTLVERIDGAEIEGNIFFPEYASIFINKISTRTSSDENYNFEFIELIK